MDYELIRGVDGKLLRISGDLPPGFHGEQQGAAWLCPLDAANAAALRRELPWTSPQPVGLRKSVGCGDRLGLATPGHIRAVRKSDMVGVFAQQSIREMERCGRSAQDVIDDATWGVLQMDYREGYGSDADHLKHISDIDDCIDAGFTGFTLDPNEHVDNAAHSDDAATLLDKIRRPARRRTGDDPRRFTSALSRRGLWQPPERGNPAARQRQIQPRHRPRRQVGASH